MKSWRNGEEGEMASKIAAISKARCIEEAAAASAYRQRKRKNNQSNGKQRMKIGKSA